VDRSAFKTILSRETRSRLCAGPMSDPARQRARGTHQLFTMVIRAIAARAAATLKTGSPMIRTLVELTAVSAFIWALLIWLSYVAP